MAGRNLAILLETNVGISEFERKDKCVFISHRKSDIRNAWEIAERLMKNNIDVYLDENDKGLNKAVEENDVEAIVGFIDVALSYSTDILVLLSKQTQESWWVPYEIGYAKKTGTDIASFVLDGNQNGFPEYLQIEKQIRTNEELEKYISDMKKRKKRYGNIFENVESVTGLK